MFILRTKCIKQNVVFVFSYVYLCLLMENEISLSITIRLLGKFLLNVAMNALSGSQQPL